MKKHICYCCGKDADIRDWPGVDIWICDQCCWDRASWRAVRDMVVSFAIMAAILVVLYLCGG